MATFAGIENIDWNDEYLRVRDAMGTRGTDFKTLTRVTTLLYIGAPESMRAAWEALLREVLTRWRLCAELGYPEGVGFFDDEDLS